MPRVQHSQLHDKILLVLVLRGGHCLERCEARQPKREVRVSLASNGFLSLCHTVVCEKAKTAAASECIVGDYLASEQSVGAAAGREG